MEAPSRPRVICVDDEPHIVSGLALHLRRRYDVEIATSGQAGLELLERVPEAAVVLSDMRMPQMSGAEFLAKASVLRPHTTRMLLTGYAEIEAAIKAINEGQIFRFLIKPCPPPELLRVVEAGAQLHRTVVAEKVLLEQTLHGSIKMLCEVLAVTSPAAFGRAARVKRLVGALAEKLNETERWQIEVAAMLSQLSSISLPNETVEKVYYGMDLSSEEQRMVARAPDVTRQLLGHIPRLEAVREILALYPERFRKIPDGDGAVERRRLQRSAQLLKAALELDALEARGLSPSDALLSLKTRADEIDPEVVQALVEVCGETLRDQVVREVPLSALKPGMIFAADVKLTAGALLVARGFEVTSSFLERLHNFRPGSVREPLKVIVRDEPPR